MVLSDLAYAEIYFDGNPPPSILQVDGAKDIAVEFTLPVQDFFHARLAHGLCCGQRAHDHRVDPC